MELDQEVLEYLDDYNLKEEKNKKYSAITCSKNIVYIFNTDMEFKNYFYKYGIKEELPLNLLKEVIIKITRKGKMICSKRYMDKIINELTKKEVFMNIVNDFYLVLYDFIIYLIN